jgi:thioredoxin 1
MKKLDLFKFKEIVDIGKPFIVKFKSDGCSVCTDLEPDYEDVARSFPELDFYDVDVNEEENLADLFISDGVPTLYYIHGKKFKELDYPQQGFDKKSLTKAIKKHFKV